MLLQVEEHDHEQEQDHDGPGVDEDLDDPDERRVQREVEARDREHRLDHPERARDGAPRDEHPERAGDGEHGEHEEEERLQHVGRGAGPAACERGRQDTGRPATRTTGRRFRRGAFDEGARAARPAPLPAPAPLATAASAEATLPLHAPPAGRTPDRRVQPDAGPSRRGLLSCRTAWTPPRTPPAASTPADTPAADSTAADAPGVPAAAPQAGPRRPGRAQPGRPHRHPVGDVRAGRVRGRPVHVPAGRPQRSRSSRSRSRLGAGGMRLRHVSAGGAHGRRRAPLPAHVGLYVGRDAVGDGRGPRFAAFFIARENGVAYGQVTAFMLFTMLMDQLWFAVLNRGPVRPRRSGCPCSRRAWARPGSGRSRRTWAGCSSTSRSSPTRRCFRPELIERLANRVVRLRWLRAVRAGRPARDPEAPAAGPRAPGAAGRVLREGRRADPALLDGPVRDRAPRGPQLLARVPARPVRPCVRPGCGWPGSRCPRPGARAGSRPSTCSTSPRSSRPATGARRSSCGGRSRTTASSRWARSWPGAPSGRCSPATRPRRRSPSRTRTGSPLASPLTEPTAGAGADRDAVVSAPPPDDGRPPDDDRQPGRRPRGRAPGPRPSATTSGASTRSSGSGRRRTGTRRGSGRCTPRDVWAGRVATRQKRVGGRSFEERLLPVASVEGLLPPLRRPSRSTRRTTGRSSRRRGKPSPNLFLLERYAEAAARERTVFAEGPRSSSWPGGSGGRSRAGGRSSRTRGTSTPAAFARQFVEPAQQKLGARGWRGVVVEQPYERGARFAQGPRRSWPSSTGSSPTSRTTCPYHLEVRSSHQLSPAYAEWLAERGLGFCFSHWQWLPPIVDQWRLVGERFTSGAGAAVLRLIQPRGPWPLTSRSRSPTPFEGPAPGLSDTAQARRMVDEATALMYQAVEAGVTLDVVCNNRAWGERPPTSRARWPDASSTSPTGRGRDEAGRRVGG